MAVREALENPRTQSEYYWGLSFAAGSLRKLVSKPNGGASINLSAAHLKEAGLEGAEVVQLVLLPQGGLAVLRATDNDVSEARAQHTDAPRPCLPARPAPADRPEVAKRCPQCRLSFRTRQQRRIYCDGCRHERDKASYRRSWHRRRKRNPTYQQRAKPGALAGMFHARDAESLTLPFGGESESDAGITRPLALSAV